MHPTTVSQLFALIAVVTLSVAIAVSIYRLTSQRRKRHRRPDLVAATVSQVVASPIAAPKLPAGETPIPYTS